MNPTLRSCGACSGRLFLCVIVYLAWATRTDSKSIGRYAAQNALRQGIPIVPEEIESQPARQPCKGYKVETLSETKSGVKAHLSLIGSGCHVFSEDILDLTIEVTYETVNRIHVHIYDTAKAQYRIPVEVFPLPVDLDSSAKSRSALAFEYTREDAFQFWIRRTDGSDEIIFDTRSHPLVFETQYLELSSSLPDNANIFGLGEYVASSGFRRDPYNTTQTFWTRDKQNPVNENEYGAHPVYFEHRFPSSSKDSSTGSKSHAVFLKNSHGMDILLRKELVQYRAIGGTLDFYFLAGPTPISAIEQYVQLVGLPQLQSYWTFGFHLCRWGYDTVAQTKEAVTKMREANIPLEVQWNDIDYMLAYQNFELASDKSGRFAVEDMKAFISELHNNHQYYVPIVDAGIHKIDPQNKSDIYDVYSSGAALNTFLKNPDGQEYIGKVWPGYTVFPDWFSENTQKWWTEAFRNFSERQVNFDGIWLDMNEPASFCEGSCGTGANLSDVDPGFILPGLPGHPVVRWPEGYNPDIWGRSGNMTINHTLTYQNDTDSSRNGHRVVLEKRSNPVPQQTKEPTDAELNHPGYSIHNGDGPINARTVSVNATHANGLKLYHTHNIWGHMEAIATHKTLLELHPNRRPFIVSRSTFASGGRKTSHWLGDNWSTWKSMKISIQGVLQFQAFGIPMVGPDTCGFEGNTDEELCNRWMMLSAFYPFYRNHNILGAIDQEPYVWDSVAEASRRVISIRYRLLPYFYSEMAQASFKGTPPIKALFWEFPDEESLLANDEQFMFGRAILVSPVLEPNATTLKVTFPGNADEIWRDWYTLREVNRKGNSEGAVVILPAPISFINLHIRGGSILLLHFIPAYTTYETRQGPFELLVALDRNGYASAKVYMDDGSSVQPDSAWLEFKARPSGLRAKKRGDFRIDQRLERLVIVGMINESTPSLVRFEIDGRHVDPKLIAREPRGWVLDSLKLDLNESWELMWS